MEMKSELSPGFIVNVCPSVTDDVTIVIVPEVESPFLTNKIWPSVAAEGQAIVIAAPAYGLPAHCLTLMTVLSSGICGFASAHNFTYPNATVVLPSSLPEEVIAPPVMEPKPATMLPLASAPTAVS